MLILEYLFSYGQIYSSVRLFLFLPLEILIPLNSVIQILSGLVIFLRLDISLSSWGYILPVLGYSIPAFVIPRLLPVDWNIIDTEHCISLGCTM